jgi:hypothetical protein
MNTKLKIGLITLCPPVVRPVLIVFTCGLTFITLSTCGGLYLPCYLNLKKFKPQVSKMIKFKPQVGNIKTGLTTGGQSVINP